MRFIKSNPHPTGKKIGDCVVRAIAIGTNRKWEEVYKSLCDVGLELKDMPNSKPVYTEYLKRRGWVMQKMPKHPNGKRMRLSEFAEQHPRKTFIASVVSHLTVVEENTLLDMWDCGHKCIGNYYTYFN